MEPVLALLTEWGIPHYAIPAPLFLHAATRTERAGQWEWSVNATGRAIARHAPRDQTWRMLA
jgi:hypothetical protein